MDIELLNSQLLKHGIEIVCTNCVRQPHNFDRPLTPHSTSPPKLRDSESRSKKIRKASTQIWSVATPAKERGTKGKMNPKGQKRREAPPEIGLSAAQNRECLYSPHVTEKRVLPPNCDLNLNIDRQTYKPVGLNIRQLLEETMKTPQKIDEVYLLSNHKNSNVLDLEFKPQLFSTADHRLESVEGDSMKDFSFDIPQKENFEHQLAFRNLPSPFQSPFIPTRAFITGGTPNRNINFDKLPKSLDFLENPFLADI